jgi:hypothetical protein
MNIDKLPRLEGGSAAFGTIVHDVVLWMETHRDADGRPDLDGAIQRFKELWTFPERVLHQGVPLRIDYYERGRNWVKFMEMGPDLLTRWCNIIEWESDLVLAREFEFDVPVGNGHVLHGTIDKLALRFRAATDENVLLISDYKTNAKVPTYEYIEEDLQFTAYSYATLQVEFWLQLAFALGLTDVEGRAMFEAYKNLPRYGEWVALQTGKRMDAGIREDRHHQRFVYAVNALADSVAMRIFVPNISGEACRYCEFRKQCGLPEIMED